MGRKSKKAKASGTSKDKKKSFTKAYTNRLSLELKEHIAETCEGYFTEEEQQEIEECIKYLDLFIWSQLWDSQDSSDWCISKSTIRRILGNDEPPEELTDDMDLVITLLTADSLKKGFDNVLLYLRFLRMCCLHIDEEEGTARLRSVEEQYRCKKLIHLNWRFKKWGICVYDKELLNKDDYDGDNPDVYESLNVKKLHELPI